MDRSRREFIGKSSAGGLGLLTFSIAGCDRETTAADARAKNIPLTLLNAEQGKELDVLGEVLLPGSAAAGLAHYIDHQLASAPADNMLMIKYLGVPAPFPAFYQGGLDATNKASKAMFKKPLVELAEDEARLLVGNLASGQVQGWNGPPAGLFYFVLRADAVDVVYGTRDGFAKLDIPYMAHIEPPTPWDA